MRSARTNVVYGKGPFYFGLSVCRISIEIFEYKYLMNLLAKKKNLKQLLETNHKTLES